MIRYLSLAEVIDLHGRIIADTGGAAGLRDLGALESALGQPRQSFGGEDLYPTLVSKAAALGFSLVMTHPFVDGNKWIGHAATEAFLMLNGVELTADVDSAEAETSPSPPGTGGVRISSGGSRRTLCHCPDPR